MENQTIKEKTKEKVKTNNQSKDYIPPQIKNVFLVMLLKFICPEVNIKFQIKTTKQSKKSIFFEKIWIGKDKIYDHSYDYIMIQKDGIWQVEFDEKDFPRHHEKPIKNTNSPANSKKSLQHILVHYINKYIPIYQRDMINPLVPNEKKSKEAKDPKHESKCLCYTQYDWILCYSSKDRNFLIEKVITKQKTNIIEECYFTFVDILSSFEKKERNSIYFIGDMNDMNDLLSEEKEEKGKKEMIHFITIDEIYLKMFKQLQSVDKGISIQSDTRLGQLQIEMFNSPYFQRVQQNQMAYQEYYQVTFQPFLSNQFLQECEEIKQSEEQMFDQQNLNNLTPSVMGNYDN